MPAPVDQPQLSVVAPCYDEAEVIATFYQALKNTLQTVAYTYEIVFVDDGSTDETLAILNQLAERDPHVRVLSLTRNFGHQIALTAGLDYACGRNVLVMDSDLQHPPELIPQMLRELETGVDVVYAVRQETDQGGLLKRLTSKWFYQMMNQFGATWLVPSAADFRLMSERATNSLRAMRERHRFLRGMVSWTGYPSRAISFHPNPRFAGRSKYSWIKMFRLAFDAAFSFSILPLRVMTILGLLMIALGLAYLAYILAELVLLPDRVQPGWPSLLASLLILSGVQLLSLGVIATYVGMIFEQVKDRPLYFLKQTPRAHEDQTS